MKRHIRLIIIALLVFLAGVMNSQMDTLVFRYNTSRYSKMENQQYWNPDISWLNKYKNQDPQQGPRFFLSTTVLVFLTDGWHLFQFLQLMFFGFAILVGIDYRYKVFPWLFVVVVFGVKALYGMGHNLFFGGGKK